MKVVAFSLFGPRELYHYGAISNAKLMPKIYPDWQMWVWYDDSVPDWVITELDQLGVHVVRMVNSGITGKMWRLLAHDLEGCERFVCRDTDSRISERERNAVDAWESSGLDFHIMRDHPGHHDYPIMAGMWGAKGRAMVVRMESLIRAYVVPARHYGYDQSFLRDYVWPRAKTRCLIHDSSGRSGVDFPDPRGDRFVGEVFTTNDQPTKWVPYDYKA